MSQVCHVEEITDRGVVKDLLIITRDSEVIMFSPCLFVSLCLCHDDCPDDLTMKDWCHTNSILQVHCCGCLVVQVIFHALMTSLTRLQSRSKFENNRFPSIFAQEPQSNAQNIEMLMLSFWYIQLPVSLPVKKFVASSKCRPFWKF